MLKTALVMLITIITVVSISPVTAEQRRNPFEKKQKASPQETPRMPTPRTNPAKIKREIEIKQSKRLGSVNGIEIYYHEKQGKYIFNDTNIKEETENEEVEG